MNISNPVPSVVKSVSFSFLGSEDVRRISVKQIVNPVLLDSLNRPNIGGLYDPALGPTERQDVCTTCRLNYYSCPGHFGHIELPVPVFHPLFIMNTYNLLRTVCLFCHHFKMNRIALIKYHAKLRLLEYGLLSQANSLDDLPYFSSKKAENGAKSSTRRKRKEDDNEVIDEEPEEELEEPEETPEEFQRKIEVFVKLNLMKVEGSSSRDNYKDGLVYQARKDIILDFLRNAIAKKCQNPVCEAYAYSFRKEGHTKIVEYDLTSKQKRDHRAHGKRRVDVMSYLSRNHTSAAQPEAMNIEGSDVDSDEEKEEEREEEGPSFDNVRQQHDMGDVDHVPKAITGKVKTKRGRNERIVTPEEVREHLRRLFHNEAQMCSMIFGRHGAISSSQQSRRIKPSPDMFFLEVIPVSPTRFRPPAKLGETLFEHPANELLAKVLNTTYQLRDITSELQKAYSSNDKATEPLDKPRLMARFLDELIQLQVDVNSFIDSSKNPTPMRQGKLPPAGVKQGLEKKEGLFRKNMMGKRVNYAARSVISPDVNIEPSEIGVPPVFARKLTFPEPVTPHNFHHLRQLVEAGTTAYPGAAIVEYEDGSQQFLDKLDEEKRRAIADQLLTPKEVVKSASLSHGLLPRASGVGKKVYRHLVDGDVLILNRQPTLHKPSMMAHRARVLKGEKTIRMHYANCNSYNADFDGDEMNIHFPQNQVARAEAELIANTDNQYLVPTSGKPLRGLIQDHVVAGVWMTNKSSFFTRDEYQQLLYGALRPEDELLDGVNVRLKTLPPTIWKPQPLWTGKQIISTILLNITPSNAAGLNLTSKAKVPNKLWGKNSNEEVVIVFGGQLLCGILDKSQFGASEFGLVHAVYELYGAPVAGRLLGIFSRLFTKFMQHRAFTCRMDDLALTPEGDARRHEIMRNASSLGTQAAMHNFAVLDNVAEPDRPAKLKSLLREILHDNERMAALDAVVQNKMRALHKSIADAVMPSGLIRKFPANHMQTMTISGAKGSTVNVQQISCALGQQALEGRRVPIMVSGKTLPCFEPFETNAIAGGYIGSRFLTGIKPQEFFFHCMAGREGLIDTAVKTSRSGYLQRCLIKHLEGIRVHYDNTVRGSDQSIYQFCYGGDGLDVTKQKHLYQFEFSTQNSASLIDRYHPHHLAGKVDDAVAAEYMKKALKKLAKNKPDPPTPALSVFNPARFLGSTSERFAQAAARYLQENPHNLLSKNYRASRLRSRITPLSAYSYRMLMNLRYIRSLVEPGEAVGLLASQGVGEPSTQMTLNTFHFAGHGAANVTLGIPRLREIIMAASIKPKTPTMTIRSSPQTDGKALESFCKQASRLALSQIVDFISVEESITPPVDGRSNSRQKCFKVDIRFYPTKEFTSEYHVTTNVVASVIGSRFSQVLKRELALELKKLDADFKLQKSEIGKGKSTQKDQGTVDDTMEEDGPPPRDDALSEVGDGDAEDAKHARQTEEQTSYSDDESSSDDEGPDEREAPGEVKEADPSGSSAQSKRAMNVKQMFMGILPNAKDFTFKDDRFSFTLLFELTFPKILLVGVLERAFVKTIVREIPGISDCFVLKEQPKLKKGNGPVDYQVLMTNGANIRGLWSHVAEKEEIQLENIYTNDIHAMLVNYGVEAARATLVNEISTVFGAYNIDVDFRHLELIADYMTFDGGYKPFNRKGISTSSSPLLKASYETTASFICDAALFGDFDDLTTPSGSIVMGRPTQSGTGSFDVILPLTERPKSERAMF